MALELLHGSLASIDISLGGTSVKCVFSRWMATIVRGATAATTFCSGGWVEEQPGMRQLLARLDGFASKGTAYSNPLTYITATDTIPVVLTADMGCTLTFEGNVFEDGIELNAAANGGRGISLRSSGAVVAAWVAV